MSLFKPIIVFALIWLVMPSTIDMGSEARPSLLANAKLSHARVIVLDALNRVREDLANNRSGTKFP